MGKRCFICVILGTCALGILPFCSSPHNQGVSGDREHARVVPVRTGNDVSKRVGIPEPSVSDSPIHSESLPWPPITTWDTDTMKLIDILHFEEGFRPVPYLCSEGYITIGLGTKLHLSKGMIPDQFLLRVTLATAEEWLHTEVATKSLRLKRINRNNVGKTFTNLDDDRRAIILSMAYQMGAYSVSNFSKMWKNLELGNYREAAVEALDSRWARQTPERAERHARVLRGESLSSIYERISNPK